MANRVNGVSVIANGLIINGNITGDGDINIAGCIEGQVLIKNGTMTIDQMGYVEGDIIVKEVLVAGEVRGSIEAESKITIQSTGKVLCDVKTSRIDIAEGAFLCGNFEVEDKLSERK